MSCILNKKFDFVFQIVVFQINLLFLKMKFKIDRSKYKF